MLLLNINQDNLVQPGVKDQQDYIVWAALLFGGAEVINPQN